MGIPISNLNSGYNQSALFNSLPQARSGAMENLTNTMLGNSSALSLTDYASIKNGSYKSLLKAYYSDTSAKDAEKASRAAIQSDNAKSQGVSENKEKTSALTAASGELEKAAAALTETGRDSLFKKKSAYGSDGDMINYDSEKLISGVKDFVKSYNSVLSSGAKSADERITNSLAGLKAAAGTNAERLAKAGIAVGTDGKLSIDEKKLKNADVSDLKEIFNDKGSFGAQARSYADQVNYYSTRNDENAKSGYNAAGGYGSAQSLVNRMYDSYL